MKDFEQVLLHIKLTFVLFIDFSTLVFHRLSHISLSSERHVYYIMFDMIVFSLQSTCMGRSTYLAHTVL